MKGSSQFAVVLRRMSVVYIFLIAIALLLLIYYYYIIPGRKTEFSERSSRALKTLVYTYKKEVDGLKDLFSQKSLKDTVNLFKLIGHEESYKKLYENIRYEVDTNWKAFFPEDKIQYHNDWKLVFEIDSTKWRVQVPVQDFSNRIFISRTDVFDSYILLLPDTEKTLLSKTPPWHIIYKQYQNTSSDLLMLDSSEGLFRNSDMSTTVEVTIGGKLQKIFLNSFNLGNQVLVLGGIINKTKYDRYTHSISVNLVVATIIFIILLLIILPLLKIYFLSRNETIYSRDVIASCVSVFIGTAAILLILIFCYLYSISSESFHSRMKDIGNQISTDVEKQLDSADKQLDKYVRLYNSLSSEREKKVLTYLEKDPVIVNHVDSLFYPDIFPHLARILWIDSAGETLAKWNPFDYKTPFTNVKDYSVFKRLKAINDHTAPQEKLLVYSGKSNLTGEFRVHIIKPLRQRILTVLNDTGSVEKNSIGILLTTSLYCNTFPILPPGFGFCLIDNKGDVLLHSDETRNLAENFFEETRFNQQVLSNVQQQTNTVITNVTLYGAQHDVVIKRVKGQPLYIAVFFPTKRIISNISRFLHFTIACLIALFGIIILFILYLTYHGSKPSQLRLQLNRIQWIRPAAGNRYAYQFSQWYFFSLITISVISFICIQALDFDFRQLLYISFLLPFYALIGLITANQRLINNGMGEVVPLIEFSKTKMRQFNSRYLQSIRRFFSMMYDNFTNPLVVPSIMILFLNLQFIISLAYHSQFIEAIFPLVFVQSTFIWAFFFFYGVQRNRLNEMIRNEKTQNTKMLLQNDVSKATGFDENNDISNNDELVPNNYLWSLYFVLILVTVLPTFGIGAYAYFSEKTQYKKAKELFIAQQVDRKYRYVQSQYRANYNPLLAAIDQKRRPDLSLLMHGNYLSDHDTIEIKNPPIRFNGAIYDEPYRNIINQMYTYTSSYFGEFAMGNVSGDRTTWNFTSQNDSLVLRYKNTVGELPVVVSSYYQNPLRIFLTIFRTGGFIFPVIILLFLVFLFWYLGSTMQRLFLLNFSRPCEVNKDYLDQYLKYASTDPLYPNGAEKPLTVDFFKKEEEIRDGQEEYILKMTFSFLPVYTEIWEDLSEKEKYILYDLSIDGYTNYKNTDIIFQLLTKGILKYEDYKLKFFSISFQNFVAGQREDSKMQEIISRYNVGGMWRSLRVPLLVISGVIAIFVVLTQSEVAHDLTAFIGSIVALIPLLIQLFGRSSTKTQS